MTKVNTYKLIVSLIVSFMSRVTCDINLQSKSNSASKLAQVLGKPFENAIDPFKDNSKQQQLLWNFSSAQATIRVCIQHVTFTELHCVAQQRSSNRRFVIKFLVAQEDHTSLAVRKQGCKLKHTKINFKNNMKC